MIKTKEAFLEGRLFSIQSELFEYFSNCSDWLDKSDHENRLYVHITQELVKSQIFIGS